MLSLRTHPWDHIHLVPNPRENEVTRHRFFGFADETRDGASGGASAAVISKVDHFSKPASAADMPRTEATNGCFGCSAMSIAR